EKVANSEKSPGRIKGLSVDDIFQANARHWFKLVRSRFNRLRNGHLISDDNFIIQQLCRALVELDTTDREFAALLQDMRTGGWLQIPLLQCWLALEALSLFNQIQRGGRAKYNDEWDRFRAAEAYHFADCFVTDRPLTSAIRELQF